VDVKKAAKVTAILRYGHRNFTSREVLAAFDLPDWQVNQL
jgi:hypothetical protein